MAAPAFPVELASAREGTRAVAGIRWSESVLAVYFVYLGSMAVVRGRYPEAVACVAVPLALYLLARRERAAPCLCTSVARDWLATALILFGYWSLGWFATPPADFSLERRWAAFDRRILEGMYLRRAIESAGPLLPAVLDLCYLLLYSLPPLFVAYLYVLRRRERVDAFLFTLLSGTLAAYALIPHFHVTSPRLVFPTGDLPGVSTIFGRWNVAILNSMDISTGVFPSGHVAVAFSAALAACLALPERKWTGRLLLVFALLVSMDTLYARYHYVFDAFAAAGIAAAAGAAGFLLRRAGAAPWASLDRR